MYNFGRVCLLTFKRRRRMFIFAHPIHL